MVWLTEFGVTVHEILRLDEILKNTAESTKDAEILYFQGLTSC